MHDYIGLLKPRSGNIGDAWVEGRAAEAPSRGGYLRPRGEEEDSWGPKETKRTVMSRTAVALDDQSCGTV